MTLAWSNELVAQAAEAADCGHLARKRFRDKAGTVRCAECERVRKRGYDPRRAERNRRHDRSRARGPQLISKGQLERARVRLTLVEELPERPRTRGDCANVPRPCPFVGCRYSMYLDVTDEGGLRLNFPGLEPEDMEPTGSCALDLADQGARDDFAVGERLNVVRERVRQLQNGALAKLAEVAGSLRELVEE